MKTSTEMLDKRFIDCQANKCNCLVNCHQNNRQNIVTSKIPSQMHTQLKFQICFTFVSKVLLLYSNTKIFCHETNDNLKIKQT